MKVTLSEIARATGVSVTTVDRVLNDRGGVRARTRATVLDAAQRLGWFGPVATQTPPDTRMDFLLPSATNPFMNQLRACLLDEAQNAGGVRAMVHIVDGLDPDAVVSRLLALTDQTAAVGLVALDHPAVRAALETLTQSGIPVATLVTDIPSPHKIGYVGVDNRSAGRLAGLLMGRFLHPDRAHEVVVAMGSLSYRGHEEREMGVRSILSQDFPNLTITQVAELRDNPDRAYTEFRRILAERPPAAIYNIGSGVEGIGQALQEAGLAQKTVFIGHDVTTATKPMLLDGTLDAVIDQNARVAAREAIRLLASALRGSPERQYPPRLQVIFAENIPTL